MVISPDPGGNSTRTSVVLEWFVSVGAINVDDVGAKGWFEEAVFLISSDLDDIEVAHDEDNKEDDASIIGSPYWGL